VGGNFKNRPDRSSVASIAFAGLSSKSGFQHVRKRRRGWTGVPVEMRAPLLDLRLLRFHPASAARTMCMKKRFLREAMHGMLPEEVPCAENSAPR